MNAPSNEKNDCKVISVISCGLKHAPAPADAALLIDCRGFINPYWNETLRPLTGEDEAVADFLKADKEVQAMLASLPALLRAVLPGLVSRSNYHEEIKLVFLCTGGKHRSRFFASQARKIVDAIVTEHPEWNCSLSLIHRDHGRE
jgi:RNase adapter protein RapZ